MTKIVLWVQDLSKSYGDPSNERLVLDRIDLEARAGEFVCIVGPSGTGKTPLLRCMAGLLTPSRGAVRLDGEIVSGPPQRLAVVFQDCSRSLLPWMSVLKNVLLPLRAKPMTRDARLRLALDALKAVGLAGTENRYPWQLSGGMQQRVAIARALAYQPEALLMDEPFASVDAQTRAELEDLILRVRDQFGVTVVLVTHDIDEAVYLADQVVVLTGSPTRVRMRIDVPLPLPRDQIATKSLPQFAGLRSTVLSLIRERPQERPPALVADAPKRVPCNARQ